MTKHTFDRRRLLINGANSTLAALAASRAPLGLGGTRRPRADAPDPHFFVFGQIYGAWDVCLAFDPKDRTAKLPNGDAQFDQPYAIEDVKQYGAIRLAPDGQVLSAYADRMTIINGIDMEVDNGHSPDNMMAGLVSPRAVNAPFMQAALAKRQPFVRTTVLPHIYASYDGMFYPGAYGGSSVSAKAGDALKLLAGTGGPSFDAVSTLVQGYQGRLASAADRRLVALYGDAAAKAGDVTARLAQGGFVTPDDPESPAGFGLFVGQLFQRGILGSVTWSLGERYSFDTHSDHYAKHPLGKALADVAALAGALAALPFDEHTSVMDRTTIVLSGEFSRTARLNAGAGKDHNIRANSLVFIGKNAPSGVFGMADMRQEADGTTEPHAALPIDFATGAALAGGETMKARNVWAGVTKVFGVDLSPELGADVLPVRFLG